MGNNSMSYYDDILEMFCFKGDENTFFLNTMKSPSVYGDSVIATDGRKLVKIPIDHFVVEQYFTMPNYPSIDHLFDKYNLFIEENKFVVSSKDFISYINTLNDISFAYTVISPLFKIIDILEVENLELYLSKKEGYPLGVKIKDIIMLFMPLQKNNKDYNVIISGGRD